MSTENNIRRTPGLLQVIGSENVRACISGVMEDGSNTYPLLEVSPCQSLESGYNNACRLVDCWNACAGIDDPADLRRQRDELLDALQAIVTGPGLCGPEEWRKASLRDAIARGREAIARATSS